MYPILIKIVHYYGDVLKWPQCECGTSYGELDGRKYRNQKTVHLISTIVGIVSATEKLRDLFQNRSWPQD